MNDERYMKIALKIAKKGIGNTSPNPLVGCVIVKDNKIIGTGFHEKFGGMHAERNAISNCKEPIKGSTLYVSLEPCNHHGKTPPCTDAIIENKIKRVVFGAMDKNPEAEGGMSKLLQAGIEVKGGVLEKECIRLNEDFFYSIQHKKPFTILKYAMTLDGKIATIKGESRWISGEDARYKTHVDRGRYSAIMVGINTVITDNPSLTCRIKNMRNPIRIVCDSNLKIPLDSKILSKEAKTIIATTSKNEDKIKKIEELGAIVFITTAKDNRVDLAVLFEELYKMGINSLILEGGSTLSFQALKEKLVSKIQTYIAPKIFGGDKAKSPVGGQGIEKIKDCINIVDKKIVHLKKDILIEGYVEYAKE